MKIVLLHNHYSVDTLQNIIAEMRKRGRPTIRVYDLGFDELYQAIEGCHRLRACEILGITPKIRYIKSTTKISRLTNIDVDFDDDDDTVAILGDWGNYQITIANGKIAQQK